MKSWTGLFAALFALGGQALFMQGAAAQDSDISRGEYLARAGNCVACHSTPEGEPFAGGLKMAVPMLGEIYSTNITPDPETGIGDYTFEDFDRAMRHGITKEGRRLYPAMPYPSYAKISEDDMRALYDFFMNEVAPVKQENEGDEIPGWKNVRWGLGIWNFLFHEDEPFEPDPERSESWNRGAYLVQGLGHCGACHTPRGLFFQEKALAEGDSDFLAGADLDNWWAISLNGDINSGLGRWSEQEIVDYLKTGKNRHSQAAGTMVEVVNNSTQHMSEEDLRAMAVYLKSLPPAREEGEAEWVYDETTTEALSRLNFDGPGATLYYQYCASCHGYDGSGQGAFTPALAGNPGVLSPEATSLINLTLNGSLRVFTGDRPEIADMPYFRVELNDRQIADVLTYIRNAWGNDAGAISPDEVVDMRAETEPTTNDDIIVLQMK